MRQQVSLSGGSQGTNVEICLLEGEKALRNLELSGLGRSWERKAFESRERVTELDCCLRKLRVLGCLLIKRERDL
jgi:hypothetical protein